MKKILFALVLLLAVNVFAEGYFTGVYYTKVAPTPGQKLSGDLDFTFYTDSTLDVDIYFNGAFIETIHTTYVSLVNGNLFVFRFVDSDGWVYNGSVNVPKQFVSGSFKSATLPRYSGKFQATFIDTTGQ